MNFETIIGIEIHCELNTKTKMFSSAPNTFGKEPNTQVSRVDMAFPGILPTVNKKAVEYAMMACSALNLSIDNVQGESILLMLNMKSDMSGSASVLGIIQAIAKLQPNSLKVKNYFLKNY